MAYGWIIEWANPEVFDDDLDVGVMGGNMTRSVQKSLKNGSGIQFQMRDDDGIEYYRGRLYIETDSVWADYLFSPLDNYGMPNAGCTSIEYLDTDGTWEVL